MTRNPPAVQCKRMAAIAVLCNFNRATDNYIVRRITFASVTLAVHFCLSDHTVAVQSATVDRVNCELFNVTNSLEISLKCGKHGRNLVG